MKLSSPAIYPWLPGNPINRNVGVAKALYRRALRVFQRSKKKPVPEVVSVLNRLGLILETNGEYKDAAQCFQRACELMEPEQAEKRMTRLKVLSPLPLRPNPACARLPRRSRKSSISQISRLCTLCKGIISKPSGSTGKL